MAQVTFEVPSTGTFRSADGAYNLKFTEGDVVPIELAVLLQMEGAEMPAAPNLFRDDQRAEMTALVASSVAAGLAITPKANPATCAVGELNVDLAGVLHVCSAEDTWTVVGDQTGA